MSGGNRQSECAHVGGAADTRFLEIGVGTGRIALPLALLGFSVTGIDISEGMMERLREKIDRLCGRPGVSSRSSWIAADMQSLPSATRVSRRDCHARLSSRPLMLIARHWKALRYCVPGGSLLVCGDVAMGREPVFR